MKSALAQKLLVETQKTYNVIAQEFSNTREMMWQDLLPLLDYTRQNNKVLDLGCGNGRLFEALKEKQVNYVGVDSATELIKIAKAKYPDVDFRTADSFNLPFADNTFDIIYCIAVLHHIPSNELRKKFLAEAKRVLKPNGLMISTVWKLGQKKSGLLPRFTLQKLLGKSKLDFGDVLVPWHKKQLRYVHNFTKLGLRKLFKHAGFGIERVGVLQRPEHKDYNLFIVAKK